MKNYFVSCLIILSLALGVSTAWAQGGLSDAQIDARMRGLTDKLNCPLCTGQTLTECPLQVCDEMRDLIRIKLRAGETDDQIVAYFVQQYGDRVLNEPPREGFALLGWLLPVAGLLVGVGIVVWALRSMTRRPAPAAAPSGPASALPAAPANLPREYVERLERELRQME